MQYNNRIDLMKFFAIFSVVIAHSNRFYLLNFTNVENIELLLNNIGVIGVPVFLIVSGYLYNNEMDFCVFIKKKGLRIIPPWIITGSFVFFYVTIRKGGITLSNYLDFITGNGSYLYFYQY